MQRLKDANRQGRTGKMVGQVPMPKGTQGITASPDGKRVLAIDYSDKDGSPTRRVIWPFALGFFDKVRVVVAWCEMRQGFRHFRTDRISALEPTGQRYPRRRQALMKAWREAEGIRTRE